MRLPQPVKNRLRNDDRFGMTDRLEELPIWFNSPMVVWRIGLDCRINYRCIAILPKQNFFPFKTFLRDYWFYLPND